MTNTYSVIPLEAFEDNYIWLIYDSKQHKAICVDPGDASPVLAYLTKYDIKLDTILITHHHADHIGGVKRLKQAYPNCQIISPYDQRIPISDKRCSNGEIIEVTALALNFKVLETPGHTLSHICYYTEAENNAPWLFCGDTLFSGGCGRLFEGSPQQMLNSLKELCQLPNTTQIYCAHEYTRNNLKFYQSLSSQNPYLEKYMTELNKQSMPLSLPSTLEKELQINPFLRCDQPEMQQLFASTLNNTNELDIFSHLRKLKDNF